MAFPRDVVNSAPTRWLLEQGDPWTRFHTLTALLGESAETVDVRAARQALVAHPLVRGLVNKVADWSEPLTRHNDADHALHALAVLADFGLRADDPGMDVVVGALLAHPPRDGMFETVQVIPHAFGGSGEPARTWVMCDAPTLLYALLRFGLGDEPVVQTAVERLLALTRDSGFPCASGTPGFRCPGASGGAKDDPCPIANLTALRALAEVPALHDHPAVRAGVEMLLGHWEHQTARKHHLFGIGSDFRRLKYPFVWYDVLHVTEVVSRFAFARQDARLREMVDVVLRQQDADGRYTPESVWMAWKTWDFGQKKTPSPWLTLLVWRMVGRLG